MKRPTTRFIGAAAFVAFVAGVALLAPFAWPDQTPVYTSAGGSVRVNGTSTLHNWTVTGRQIDGTIAFRAAVPAGASKQQIRQALLADPTAAAQLQIPARTLRSGNKDMEASMFHALKADEHPQITYKLGGVQVAGGGSGGTTVPLRATGELTIAGTTRALDMPLTIEVLDEERLKLSARTAIKMSDYKVERPKALAGLITAGDKVNVEVEWVVVSAERPAAHPNQ